MSDVLNAVADKGELNSFLRLLVQTPPAPMLDDCVVDGANDLDQVGDAIIRGPVGVPEINNGPSLPADARPHRSAAAGQRVSAGRWAGSAILPIEPK
jgi:hypothetical protein